MTVSQEGLNVVGMLEEGGGGNRCSSLLGSDWWEPGVHTGEKQIGWWLQAMNDNLQHQLYDPTK